MRPEHTAAVAVLDSDHDHAQGRQLVADPHVGGARSLQDHHAAAMDVQHSGQRSHGSGGSGDVQPDLVACRTCDRLRAVLEPFEGRQPVHQRGEHRLETGLGRADELQQLLARRIGPDRGGARWHRARRARVRDGALVSAWIGAQ